ncbi:hypothetical protein [Psychrobacillus lasiicapitis]|uniref:Uncharacterized protein n=1 Tax=Psychrobacillus lasiicapitis TaxID=1636719 RepID=A0A544T8R1_9BACI|nr:hypothetical protein [Psychrobacillus lasiicapitis]TQR13851.1 hypothetical protein FG382_09575 [Psychrobacillus lasiicapitis]GGA35932.1 hypothetical protein GCM10011384_27070 [Psychrobacillus lasiicapitis]
MQRKKVKFKYTIYHLQRHFFLESITIINKLKNIFVIAILVILFTKDFLFNKSFSNYDFSILLTAFDYSELDYNYLYIHLCISVVITILTALLTHSIPYYFISYAQKLSNINKIKQSNKTITDYSHKIVCLFFKIVFRFFCSIFKKNKLRRLALFSLISLHAVYRLLKKIIAFIFSPDLYFARIFKERILKVTLTDKHPLLHLEDSEIFRDSYYKANTYQWSMIRIERKAFIEWSNWTNLVITSLLLGLVAFISPKYYEFLLTIIVLRLISRGIEIAYAFYKDVVQVNSKQFCNPSHSKPVYVNGFQSSLIRQNGRLSLAIHTLIELFLIYGTAYFLLFQILVELPLKYYLPELYVDFTKPTIAPTLFESILFSTSLGMFNISFGAYQNILLAILHSSQVILSGILILLSIAQYLGADRTLNKADSYLYVQTALLRNTWNKMRIIKIINFSEKINYHFESYLISNTIKTKKGSPK